MIKVEFTRTNGSSGAARFATPELAQEWIDARIADNSFGRPVRWVREEAEGEDLNDAIETRVIQEPRMSVDEDNQPVEIMTDVTEYKMAADYSVAISDASEEYKQEQILKFQIQKDRECDDAVKALLAPSEDVTHIMYALYDFFVVLNIDGTSSAEDINASKANLVGMKNLMGQIQMLRATRDADVQAYIDSLE